MEYDSGIKMNEILQSVTTWKDLEGIVLSEISHRKTNEQAKQKQTHKYRENFDALQRGRVLGDCEKSEEIKKYKLVVTE